jgi:ribonuclease HII
MSILLPYQKEDTIEIGIDEAGRGCLFGDVFIAGVILPQNIVELIEKEKKKVIIRDSKKLSKKKRMIAKEFIERVAIDYCVVQKSNEKIDEINILQATLEGMHDVVRNIGRKPEKILVDGNRFPNYFDEEGNEIKHECVVKGDDTYLSIACASILAKTNKDLYIEKMVKEHPDLEKYDLLNNSGYGTKKHIEAIQKYGITNFHRKTFNICKPKIVSYFS